MTGGTWTASLAVVYPVEPGTSSALDVVEIGAPFDVLAAVRIGRMWMEVVDGLDVSVAVRNLSACETVLRGMRKVVVCPQRNALKQTLAIALEDAWKADDGDVLEVLATLKVCAGVHVAYSSARSDVLIAATASSVPPP